MRASLISRTALIVLAWTIALILFFPIAWTILTSFKTESSAIDAGELLHFQPTLASYSEVFERAQYLDYAVNSLIVSIGATLLVAILAVPCAYSMAFHPTRSTRG